MARDLLTPPGQGDDGRPDAVLSRALAAGGSADLPELIAALRQARVFVAVEAHLTSSDITAGADKTSEMSLATLRTSSGATALPIFSSIEALAAWRSSARPVPVAAADACAEAVRLGLGAVVIDMAGPSSISLDVSLFSPPTTPGRPAHPPVPAPSPAGSAGSAALASAAVPTGSADRAGPRDSAVTPASAGSTRAGLPDSAGPELPGPELPGPEVAGTTESGGSGSALRRPADPDGPLSRRRVRKALRAVTGDIEVWPAELALPGATAPRPVLALAVRSADEGAQAAGATIARRLCRLLSLDPGASADDVDLPAVPPEPAEGTVGGVPPVGDATSPGDAEHARAAGQVAVLLVDAREIAAVRRHLGRGLRPTRRWAVRLAR